MKWKTKLTLFTILATFVPSVLFGANVASIVHEETGVVKDALWIWLVISCPMFLVSFLFFYVALLRIPKEEWERLDNAKPEEKAKND